MKASSGRPHNDDRAPLLFISGAEDHLMPPKVQQSNARHYKSNTVTEIKEFAGRAHLMPAQAGWEDVADYALSWAVGHAAGARGPRHDWRPDDAYRRTDGPY